MRGARYDGCGSRFRVQSSETTFYTELGLHQVQQFTGKGQRFPSPRRGNVRVCSAIACGTSEAVPTFSAANAACLQQPTTQPLPKPSVTSRKPTRPLATLACRDISTQLRGTRCSPKLRTKSEVSAAGTRAGERAVGDSERVVMRQQHTRAVCAQCLAAQPTHLLSTLGVGNIKQSRRKSCASSFSLLADLDPRS